ncbi:hypothetical protein RJ639_014946, partial [Escallonia herrerae]
MFLRRFSRPLMLSARVKETTGIVGLEVVPNAREVLIGLYSRTLKEIQAVPEDEGYRKAVESFTRHRLKVCQEEQDWEGIEKRLGCGQSGILGVFLMTMNVKLLRMMLLFPSMFPYIDLVLSLRSSTKRWRLLVQARWRLQERLILQSPQVILNRTSAPLAH